jgi:hypothetical protein
MATLSLALTGATGASWVEPDKKPLTARIERLIKQLGDDEFAKREVASRELEEIDAPAIDALRQAAAMIDDLEIRTRAARVLKAIGAHACQRELTKWAGSWKSSDGTWLKITGDRWSSGTPTFGPTAGTVRVTEIQERVVFAEFAVDDGPTKGQTVNAIFRLDGDSLHYCGTYAGDYPREFKTIGNYFSCVFKRVKK